MNVPVNQTWVDTGLDVKGGFIYIMFESGQWSNTSAAGNIWTDGMGGSSYPGVMVPNAPTRSLIGKVGSQAFFVGNAYQGSHGNGRLYLGINDVLGTYNDNMGALNVAIQVR